VCPELDFRHDALLSRVAKASRVSRILPFKGEAHTFLTQVLTKKCVAPIMAHVVLTSHPSQIFKKSLPIHWGAKTAKERGPVVASLSDFTARNAIGTHGGSYSVYRALAQAAGRLKNEFIPDLTNTAPAEPIGPFPSWSDGKKIVAIDPWGSNVGHDFKDSFKLGYDIRPSIAVTKAHIDMPEIHQMIKAGKIKTDGKIVTAKGDVAVTKIALEPVWYLPGVADRFGITEGELRKGLFQHTGGMFPELITRPDIKVLCRQSVAPQLIFLGQLNIYQILKKN